MKWQGRKTDETKNNRRQKNNEGKLVYSSRDSKTGQTCFIRSWSTRCDSELTCVMDPVRVKHGLFQMEDLRKQLEDAEKRALENYELATGVQSRHDQQVNSMWKGEGRGGGCFFGFVCFLCLWLFFCSFSKCH